MSDPTSKRDNLELAVLAREAMSRQYEPGAILFDQPEANRWLGARREGVAETEGYVALGLSRRRVHLSDAGVRVEGCAETVPWADIEEAAEHEGGCYRWSAGEGLQKLQAFSETTGRFCSLYATGGAPTILVAGFPMHRIVDIEPWEDTENKVRTLRPIRGPILDTCTGLGYSAIQLAQSGASRVVTIELDPAVMELARQNPWSAELFRSPKIERIQGDVSKVIAEFSNGEFTRILHDPPTIELAGELYGEAFYRELYRVLRRGGKLFHYVGDPDSRHGRRLYGGVLRRLYNVGFRNVRTVHRAHGIVAIK